MDVFSQFYKVGYSNEIHQLLVTPSKHFFVDRQGKFIYQKELLKISLKNLRLAGVASSSSSAAAAAAAAGASPIVHYFLRDKLSGAFYSEIFCGEDLPPVEEFLLRAWDRKKGYSFGGLPDYLSVPKKCPVSDKTTRLLEALSVEPFNPGFSSESGVRVVRILESELVKYDGEPFAAVRDSLDEVLIELNKIKPPNRTLKNPRYEEKWISNIKALRRSPETIVNSGNI